MMTSYSSFDFDSAAIPFIPKYLSCRRFDVCAPVAGENVSSRFVVANSLATSLDLRIQRLRCWSPSPKTLSLQSRTIFVVKLPVTSPWKASRGTKTCMLQSLWISTRSARSSIHFSGGSGARWSIGASDQSDSGMPDKITVSSPTQSSLSSIWLSVSKSVV